MATATTATPSSAPTTSARWTRSSTPTRPRCPRVAAWVESAVPGADDSPARRRAVQAKALDLLRGLLPAASLSHMGIYASGQTYEQLILHLLAHPLPEARRYGQLILEAVQAVMPSFVTRVERPDRGGEWVAYLEGRERAADRWAARLGLDRESEPDARALGAPAARRRRRGRAAGRAALRGRRRGRGGDAHPPAALSAAERTELLSDLVGVRANRRHRPGRGFEALRYRFEVVSDYGAFRDLQRHRMLTVQWQRLTPHLGAGVPEEVQAAGCGDLYRRALDVRARSGSAGRRGPRARGALRAVAGLPHPLRPRPQRARGDAAHRAALGAEGHPATAPSRTRCTG